MDQKQTVNAIDAEIRAAHEQIYAAARADAYDARSHLAHLYPSAEAAVAAVKRAADIAEGSACTYHEIVRATQRIVAAYRRAQLAAQQAAA